METTMMYLTCVSQSLKPEAQEIDETITPKLTLARYLGKYYDAENLPAHD